MKGQVWKIAGIALCLGALSFYITARSREERENDRANRRNRYSRHYYDPDRGDRMARGFFGGATTGALIGGLAGGGRGAGIGFGVGAATGLMAGAAASENHRYDDYYDDYQEPTNDYDYDQEDTGQHDNTHVDDMSLNAKDLQSQKITTAMGDSSVEIQPFSPIDTIENRPEEIQEMETTITQTESTNTGD